jgi:hypothetical protein
MFPMQAEETEINSASAKRITLEWCYKLIKGTIWHYSCLLPFYSVNNVYKEMNKGRNTVFKEKLSAPGLLAVIE